MAAMFFSRSHCCCQARYGFALLGGCRGKRRRAGNRPQGLLNVQIPQGRGFQGLPAVMIGQCGPSAEHHFHPLRQPLGTQRDPPCAVPMARAAAGEPSMSTCTSSWPSGKLSGHSVAPPGSRSNRATPWQAPSASQAKETSAKSNEHRVSRRRRRLQDRLRRLADHRVQRGRLRRPAAMAVGSFRTAAVHGSAKSATGLAIGRAGRPIAARRRRSEAPRPVRWDDLPGPTPTGRKC